MIVGLGLSFTTVQPEPSQILDGGTREWRDGKLQWSDFKGEVPADSKFHALTNSAISLEYEGEGNYLIFNIGTIFDSYKSWKKEGVNAYVLKHEQLHFDITEYHARLLRKKIKTHDYESVQSIEKEVKQMFDDAFDNAKEMQIKYDKDTDHSLNKKKQAKWNKKVKKLLQKTSSYKNPRIKVNVSYLMRKL
jgi:hypothetical protein